MDTANQTTEIVTTTLRIKEKLKTRELREWTPDKLQSAMFKLVVYKASLGEIVAQAQKESLTAEETRKYELALAIRANKNIYKTMAEAENEALIQTHELKVAENEAEYNHTLLKNLYNDCGDMITVLQSTLKQRTTDQIQSNKTPSVI